MSATMSVKQKQWQLYYLGYYGTSIEDIDGIWGKNSINATKSFQIDAGLYKDDGIFGEQSINKSILVIKAIQKALGGLLEDGLAGQMTITATRNYQAKNSITVTGKADSNTRNKMGINMKKFGTTITNTSTNTTINTTINTSISSSTSNTTTSGVNKNTGTWWDEIKYFTKSEFKCRCGGKYCNGYPAEPSKILVKCADQVREHFGVAVNLTSGLRCPTHNANEGGVSNSRHCAGKAMDFWVTGKTADQVLAFVKTLPNIRYAYKINDRCIHMDVY